MGKKRSYRESLERLCTRLDHQLNIKYKYNVHTKVILLENEIDYSDMDYMDAVVKVIKKEKELGVLSEYDVSEALYEACKLKQPGAYQLLVRMVHKIEDDNKTTLKMLKIAAASGSKSSWEFLQYFGECCWDELDSGKTLDVYQFELEQGIEGARVKMGMVYDELLEDHMQAAHCYRLAFQEGDESAAYNLAFTYRYMKPQDLLLAEKWFEVSIKRDKYPHSLRELGELYVDTNREQLGLLMIKQADQQIAKMLSEH
ncbi:hypothetical protein FC19_GL002186 [Liquorilactobacillus aquaticus DSM 21051]|uniref:TPR repeat-containing protein n=1 Tax=Liquorilactobacillus aquaticus DSM 21051 TaxID=1423725 RepID=A0A0R2CZQ1_9LACO|nr:hypothetical protein [Liquorilactobacillus aquaticus]KRM95092.1 hypothetical protein FC19_GL002186 [Liquorilactobacillus aquaticus DSM 21051]